MTKKVSPKTCRGVRRGESRYNAFTLIELLVVVSIIAVLSGIGFKHGWLRAEERRSGPGRNRNRCHVSSAAKTTRRIMEFIPSNTDTQTLGTPRTV